MNSCDSRRFLLEKYTSNQNCLEELWQYTKNTFCVSQNHSYVTHDELYAAAWDRYYEESLDRGVFETLQTYLPQFRFPIQKAISSSQVYIEATLKGKITPKAEASLGLQLHNPEGLVLTIHQSGCGRIPVLIVPNKQDFCTIIRALCHKNEPVSISETMGAVFINGLNNWDRIHTLKENWLKTNYQGNWATEFKNNIMPNPSLYKDKLIVLSTKPYSGVKASSLHLKEADWARYSLDIRLEHECVHFFTQRNFGKASNNLHDELIADYMGIRKVLGYFEGNWLLHFMGLENFPTYRDGARLENYLGKPILSKEAFEILKTIVKNVIDTLVKFDKELSLISKQDNEARRMTTLCTLDLITIASSQGLEKLLAIYKSSYSNSDL